MLWELLLSSAQHNKIILFFCGFVNLFFCKIGVKFFTDFGVKQKLRKRQKAWLTELIRGLRKAKKERGSHISTGTMSAAGDSCLVR